MPGIDVVNVEGVILLDLRAGLLHLLDVVLVDLSAAEPVDQDMDFYAFAGAVSEDVGEFLADRPLPVDVGFESDALLGRPHGLEHGWKDLVAVDQGGDMVAGDE